MQEFLRQGETFHGLRSSRYVHKLASLVAAHIVVTYECALVDVHGHLDTTRGRLGKALRVNVVTDANGAFLNQVHVLHIVLLVVDERGGVVCAAIKQEGLEAEGDVVEEL